MWKILKEQRLHTNQTFPFSGLPRSALKSVTTSKTVIASVRTRDTSTNHTNRAVRVLRSRVNLTPQLVSTRRPSSGSAKVSRKPIATIIQTKVRIESRPNSRAWWARLVEARERHVVDARVGLLPGLLFLEGGAADRHAADVRLDMPRAFPVAAAAAAAEVIKQAHCSTIPYLPRDLATSRRDGESS